LIVAKAALKARFSLGAEKDRERARRNGLDHIEGNESRFQRWGFWESVLLGYCPRLLLGPAPLELKISTARIVLPLFPGLPYVGALSLGN
jgi:hypothetical protein